MALIDNLVSYWKLDEASGNALDAHGSNTLTDNNTVGTATGKIGNARDFESGNNEYFSIADNSSLDFSSSSFSLTVWGKLESTGNDRAILGKWGSAGNREVLIQYRNEANRLECLVSYDGTNFIRITLNPAPSVGTWFFIAFWYNSGTGQAGASLNNGTAGTETLFAVNNSTANFTIGAQSSGSFPFDGLIDEVGFWKRVLTSDERTQLYNSGNGLAYPFSSGGGQPAVKRMGGVLFAYGGYQHGSGIRRFRHGKNGLILPSPEL